MTGSEQGTPDLEGAARESAGGLARDIALRQNRTGIHRMRAFGA
jgi:hypothetical protein